MATIKCFLIERKGTGFIRKDTGEEYPGMNDFGYGAIFIEDEYPEDVHVRAPAGWANLKTWNRVGDPRKPETFSVTPSIKFFGNSTTQQWHGYLTNGVLIES